MSPANHVTQGIMQETGLTVYIVLIREDLNVRPFADKITKVASTFSSVLSPQSSVPSPQSSVS